MDGLYGEPYEPRALPPCLVPPTGFGLGFCLGLGVHFGLGLRSSLDLDLPLKIARRPLSYFLVGL